MFKLQRYFSLASLGGMALVVLTLSIFYRELSRAALIEHEVRANTALTRAFANTEWPLFADFVARAGDIAAPSLAEQPEIAELRRHVLGKMRGLDVVKVKVYNLAGLTVFSTDPAQIGEDKSQNLGFLTALAGEANGDITFRNHFDAFEGVLSNRSLVYSYIPVRSDPDGAVQAVFEVYSDVTVLVGKLGHVQRLIVGGVLGTLALLYLFLYFIVNRADRILRAQHQRMLTDEARIRHQAFHDQLTGLPNRASFAEHVADAVRRSRRGERRLAVMFIDLDRFKWINDSLGHDAGDELLRITSRRLQSCVRDGDTLFRIGGDEFTVLLEEPSVPEDAAHVAGRILDALSGAITLGASEVTVNASIGISICPNDADNEDQLLTYADTAMYLAKQGGGCCFEFFTKSMTLRANERLALETALHRAVREEEFRLHYQPRVAQDGTLVGVEALLRWQHPERGLLPPASFLEVLEETGLILPVGEWVLRTACTQSQAWQQAAAAPLRLSVNVSSRQFHHDGFVDTVREVLADSGLQPALLELELTESLIIDDVDDAVVRMHKLKSLGVMLSIDDFGSGYSSLNYLRSFPVDALKLDGAFLENLTGSERSAPVIRAIAELARSLGMDFVAEGVEDARQAEFLRAERCTEMQGFLFGHPAPPDDIARRLQLRDAAVTGGRGHTTAPALDCVAGSTNAAVGAPGATTPNRVAQLAD